MGSIYDYSDNYASNAYASHAYAYGYPQQQYATYCHDPYGFHALPPPVCAEDFQGSPCQCEQCLGRAYAFQQGFQYGQSVLPAPMPCPHPPVYTPEASDIVSEPSIATEPPAAEELTSLPTQEIKQLDPIERSVKYIFIGQLPFEVSDDTVNWVVREFGRASKVHSIEAVWKQSRQSGEMQHKGCAHVLVPRHEVDFIVRNLHHRLLMSKETILVGNPDAINHWAGRVFDAEVRAASKPVVCEPSNRQVRK